MSHSNLVMTDVGDDYIGGLMSEGIELATGQSNFLIDQLTGLLAGQTHGTLTPGHVPSQSVDIDTPNGSRVNINAVDDINVNRMVPDIEVSGVDLPNGKVDVKTGVEGGSKSIDDLINGLEETTNGKGVARNFEASGGYEQTLKDFETLNLTNVKDIQTKYGSGKVGTLSDGTKVVARQGSTTGGATLEIKVSNRKAYKIRY